MNTDLELKTGNWLLVVGSHTTVPTILRMIGRLAESGPVNVIDNGFTYNPYIVKSGTRAGWRALNRIQVHPVYSCREMLAALEGLASAPHAPTGCSASAETADGDLSHGDASQTPPRPAAGPEPFVVLDFLSTFFYFFEGLEERKSLLRLCLAQLNRLEQGSGGLVSLHLPKVLSQSESELLGMVTMACHDAYHVEMAIASPLPVRVF